MVGGHEILVEGEQELITSIATYEGPAYMTTTMTGTMDGEAENKAMVEAYTEKNIESFHQDVAIWNNKCIIDNPLMCDGDGPIHMVRKWYSQFMTDIDEVREDQVRARQHVTVEGPTVEEVIAAMG
jgi:3-ketosteroid 9alpha-monooxygenase subunit A